MTWTRTTMITCPLSTGILHSRTVAGAHNPRAAAPVQCAHRSNNNSSSLAISRTTSLWVPTTPSTPAIWATTRRICHHTRKFVVKTSQPTCASCRRWWGGPNANESAAMPSLPMHRPYIIWIQRTPSGTTATMRHTCWSEPSISWRLPLLRPQRMLQPLRSLASCTSRTATRKS